MTAICLGLGIGVGITSAGAFNPQSLAAAKQKVVANAADVSMLVIGDSTGNQVTEWVYLFGERLASAYPTHTVNYRLWNDGSNIYDNPSVIAVGSGARSITIYNASISGTRPAYLMGSKFPAAIANLSPDVVFWNHGHNVYTAGLSSPHFQGEFFASFDQVRKAHPSAPTAIVLQNPRRDSDVMAAVIAAERVVSPFYGDTIDVYSEFVARGKDPALYIDDTHPSGSGQIIFCDKVFAAWQASSGSPIVLPAQTDTLVSNLIQNGDFSDWSGETPANWTLGNVTATKELAIVEGASPYSCKLTSPSAGSYIYNTLTGGAATALAGKDVFLAVRQLVPAGQAASVGRVFLLYNDGSNITATTRTLTYGTDGWCWQMLGPVALPSNVSLIRVALYCDTAANTDSVVYYDRAILAQASAPRDML